MPYPAPIPDELSRPFWDAVSERRLVLQHCGTCDRLQYPPAPECARCHEAQALNWREVADRGHIREYLVSHDNRVRLKRADQPFNLVVITLDADPGVTFLSNLPGRAAGDVPVGAPVELTFVESVTGQLIHEWRVI
jgi:uncharacterized OB-fold protein